MKMPCKGCNGVVERSYLNVYAKCWECKQKETKERSPEYKKDMVYRYHLFNEDRRNAGKTYAEYRKLSKAKRKEAQDNLMDRLKKEKEERDAKRGFQLKDILLQTDACAPDLRTKKAMETYKETPKTYKKPLKVVGLPPKPTKSIKGMANGRSKFSDETIEALRDDYATGEYTLRTLKEKYSISTTHVHSLVHGKNRV